MATKKQQAAETEDAPPVLAPETNDGAMDAATASDDAPAVLSIFDTPPTNDAGEVMDTKTALLAYANEMDAYLRRADAERASKVLDAMIAYINATTF